MAPNRPDRSDTDAGDESDGTDADDLETRLRALHDHLAATAELPVETGAGRRLGEAEAVAADVADGRAPPAAIETRVRQVRELLSHVEGTGNQAADEHVAAARKLATEIVHFTDEGP